MAFALGSLAQSARLQQLLVCRKILLFVGVVTIAANLFGFLVVDQAAEMLLREELAEAGGGQDLAPEEIERRAADMRRRVQMESGLFVAVGVAFLVLAGLVTWLPVICTTGGLALYVGGQAFAAYLNPWILSNGWVIKLLIVAGLVRAVMAAFAYENHRAEERLVDASDTALEQNAFPA
jgi:hypothetical protein